jgi:hypothetical protein
MIDICFPSATPSFISLRLEGHVLGRRAKWKRLLQIPGLRNEVTRKEILYEHSVVCLGLSGSLNPCAPGLPFLEDMQDSVIRVRCGQSSKIRRARYISVDGGMCARLTPPLRSGVRLGSSLVTPFRSRCRVNLRKRNRCVAPPRHTLSDSCRGSAFCSALRTSTLWSVSSATLRSRQRLS